MNSQRKKSNQPPKDSEPLAPNFHRARRNRVFLIRQAWRGRGTHVFSPAEWMSDAELESIARRVRHCTVAAIAEHMTLAEAAWALFDACINAHEWSRSVDKSDSAFRTRVLPKLEQALAQANRQSRK